jgi:hypothetical protein
LLGGLLPILYQYVQTRLSITGEIMTHLHQSHPIELVGSHSTLLKGKSIDFECEGEKTWQNCTLESGVKIVQRVEVSLIVYILLRAITH